MQVVVWAAVSEKAGMLAWLVFTNKQACFHAGVNDVTRWWQLKYFFMFIPKIGEDEPILTNIFQMGWNHQLAYIWVYVCINIMHESNQPQGTQPR